MGVQEMNQVISALSTNMIIALLMLAIPWVKVTSIGEDAITIVEDSVFRIYLENFKGVN